MESKEHKEGFEIFLKEKADSYKMYPSEKVWSKLNDQLHPRKKWPYLAMAVIFLGLGFGGKIYDSRYNTQSPVQLSSTPTIEETASPVTGFTDAQTEELKQAKVIDLYPAGIKRNPVNKVSVPRSNEATQGTVETGVSPSRQIEATKGTMETGAIIYNFPVANDQNGIKEKLLSPVSADQRYLPPVFNQNIKLNSDQAVPGIKNDQAVSLTGMAKADAVASTRKKKVSGSSDKNGASPMTSLNNSKSSEATSAGITNSVPAAENKVSPVNPASTGTDVNVTATQNAQAIRVKKPGKNRLGWQLYFSPTISYRNLYGTVNKNNYSNMMMYASLPGRPSDINSAVNQSPSIGMELGTAMIYNVSNRIRLKGGLQFNYSQYNIGAYNYTAEIAPLSAAGIGHTEINAISFHRNFDGFSRTQLRNEHFSIAIPMGAELVVIGNKDVAFNIGGTVQPAVMLNNQAYMLSTNLKNYAKVPSLYRSFNINTAFEAFLTVKMGSLRWNVGPQFRYQLLSSYKQNYPIKEHLYDYGFKIGMTKTLR